MPKVTIKDVAERAGVSTATVDRAVNGRGSVSRAALARINDAVQDLGFGENVALLNHQMRPQINMSFIIPIGGGGFIDNMKTALTLAAETVEDVDINVEFREIVMDPTIIVEHLDQISAEGQGGLGLFAMDTVEVRDAIDRTVLAGTPVVTMVSDVPAAHRATFVGIDNNAAGRTAGRLMGKFLNGASGKVAVITGSMKVRDHSERFFAFRNVLSQDFRNITVLPVYETKSLDRYNLECVSELMEHHDDLVGLYLVTGGVGGVLAGLREYPNRPRPIFIAHDVTSITRRGLQSGEIDALINQDPDKIAHATISNLLTRLMPNRAPYKFEKGSIGIDVFVADNLP